MNRLLGLIRNQRIAPKHIRRGAILEALAVLLMLLVSALLGCAVLLLATPQARADDGVITDRAVAYAAHYASAVCGTLDNIRTADGVLGVIQAIQDDGLTAREAGAAVALSVSDVCPRHEPVLVAFIDQYGSVPA